MSIANYNLRLNKGWRFHFGEIPTIPEKDHGATYHSNMAGKALSLYDMYSPERVWKEVRVPHDWLTDVSYDTTAAEAGGYKQRGTGWYELKFQLNDDEIQQANLVFDGVLGHTTVYVNGTVAGRNFSGYNRFSFDVSAYLTPGAENTITLYVDARKREGWWYEGAGLYRDVRLEFRQTVSLNAHDYFIRSENNDGQWGVRSTFHVIGLDEENADYMLSLALYDADGNVIQQQSASAQDVNELYFAIETPKLWTPETPYLYDAVCKLTKQAETVDTIEAKVGIRSITWDKDKGMFLNGERYQIKGICCHQDHAGVGAAVTEEIVDYRIPILKTLGANAYRCAHHAVSEDVLRACDKYGLLVMAENRNFAISADVLYQLDSMVRHSRNHPSVFMYSIFNEELVQGESMGLRIFKKMRAHVLKFDDTRAIIGAQSFGALNPENCTDAMSVVGANYNTEAYDQIHAKYPDKPIVGTENCPMLVTRGVYKSGDNVYDNYGDAWPGFTRSLDETMEVVVARPYVAGCFPWSGFSYRGEPMPKHWPSVCCHWGFTDMCGFYKDLAYLLMAYYKEDLIVHLLPHWNWQKGETVRVCAYTNATTAELFLNGKSLGMKEVVRRRAEWQVEYQEGTIEVKAYRDGETVCDERHTVGVPYKLVLQDNYKPGDSVHIVNVSAADSNGDVIPDFCGEVAFDFPMGSMLGIGNGDPNCHTPEKSPVFNLFNGRLQMVLAANGGKLTATCDGLVGAELDL